MKSAAHQTRLQRLQGFWETVAGRSGLASQYISEKDPNLTDALQPPNAIDTMAENDIAYFCRVAGLEKKDIEKDLKAIPPARQSNAARALRRFAEEAEKPIEEFLRTHSVYDPEIERNYRLSIFSKGPQQAATRARMICDSSPEVQQKALRGLLAIVSTINKNSAASPPAPAQSP
jgi:hypothetical protein